MGEQKGTRRRADFSTHSQPGTRSLYEHTHLLGSADASLSMRVMQVQPSSYEYLVDVRGMDVVVCLGVARPICNALMR